MRLLNTTTDLTMVDEDHLGGFFIEKDPATYMPNLWEYICKTYKINSVIDVGCGMGHALEVFKKFSGRVRGIEGSVYVKKFSKFKDDIVLFNFTKNKFVPNEVYDLAWSCEFVEHVEEAYIENYFDIFKNSKFCAITYAGPDQVGHHHVNCNTEKYWKDLFIKNNFTFLEEDLALLKKESMKDASKINPYYMDNHFFNRGLFFKNNILS